MKLYFQRSVYALIAMENQRSLSQLTEVGVTSEREEEVWRDGWCWLSLAQGSRIRPISQLVLHRGMSLQPCPSTKQWTPWKRSLLRVRVPLAQPLKRNTKGSWMSFAQKQGGRAPVLLLHHIEMMAWEQSPSRQPKSLFIIAMGWGCIFCTFISPRASFLRDTGG